MSNKIKIIAIAVMVLLIGFMVAYKLYSTQQEEKTKAVMKSSFSKLSPDYSPKLGPDTAKVVLVEFLDPECESCREFYPFVKSLMQEYSGTLQLVVRYAPFHPNSMMAIKILEASRKQGKYWETLETLFKYQPQWGSHHDPKPDLMWKYLPEAGVDVERIRTDMNDPAIEKMIQKEVDDLKIFNVRATPTFFANGTMLQEFSYEALKALVQREIDK